MFVLDGGCQKCLEKGDKAIFFKKNVKILQKSIAQPCSFCRFKTNIMRNYFLNESEEFI
jgi:hypothetical protein